MVFKLKGYWENWKKKLFFINVLKFYVENIGFGVVFKIGFVVEEIKELYYVKVVFFVFFVKIYKFVFSFIW